MRKSYLIDDIDVVSPVYVFLSGFSDDYCIIKIYHIHHIDYTEMVSHQYVSSHVKQNTGKALSHWLHWWGFSTLCVLISSLRLLFYREIYHLDHMDIVSPKYVFSYNFREKVLFH